MGIRRSNRGPIEAQRSGFNNQFTMLAHQGRFAAPDLHDMIQALGRVYDKLDELACRERR